MNKLKSIGLLLLPLAVGGISSLLSGNMAQLYTQLNQPPFSPPGWVFPVVWTILYLLMGYASARVFRADDAPRDKRRALTVYFLQLAVNGLWSVLFFRLQWFLAALVWIVLLWALIVQTMRLFSRVDEGASDLLIPYLLWVTFATYLNFGFWLIN